MATLNTRDPVQGLIDYVKDVKPFHTKILEVWVEYIYGDAVNGTIVDEMRMEVDIAFDRARKYCKYGWDMQVWNKMLADLDIDEIVPGSITYATGKTVKKSTAFQLYFDYLCDVWRFNNGEIAQPVISSDPTTKYYLLSFSSVLNAAKTYFATIQQQFEYWYEPSTRKLYKKIGNEWHEQSAFVSILQPMNPQEQDLWVNTVNMTLFVYMSGTWEEVSNFYVTYKAPNNPPRYPPEWNSNWDRPECNPPYGETWVYAYIEEELAFEHGNELFLNENIRAMVFDPTGEPQNVSGGLARTEYPIKYKTIVTQEPDGRYNITREEISIITDPTNPEIINNPYAITLDGYEFEGYGLDRHRRGVRLTEFLVWKFKSETEGMQLVADSVLNRDTFGFRVSNGHLVAQSLNNSGRIDIDCPYADGSIVYFTSSDDLPTYSLLSQDFRRPIPLQRYTPYMIKKINAREFSVQIVKPVEQFDPVTGNRIAPNYTTWRIDTVAMGSSPYLTFVSVGTGQQFFGFGHPIPFIELRSLAPDEKVNGKIKDGLASTTESFPGWRYSQISDVIIGYNDSGTTRNGFVVEGDYTKLAKGEIIQVIGSAGSKNDGDWVVSFARLWTNVQLDSHGVPVRDGNGRMIQLPVPAWWNEMMMGDWPQANLLGDEYYKVTTIGVSGTAPSTQYPFGNLAFRYYNFSEPTVSQNIAQTQVKEQLLFGSYVYVDGPDGPVLVPEPGVPGVSIVFKDSVNITIQEQLVPNGYGIPTIGSFDVHYYDINSYDDGVSRQ